jgi:hypothetical protein
MQWGPFADLEIVLSAVGHRAWGLGVGLTTPHRKKTNLLQKVTQSLGPGRILWMWSGLDGYRWRALVNSVMNNDVFWVVTPCGSCKNRRFGGTWRLLHQGVKIGALGTTQAATSNRRTLRRNTK